MVVGAEIEDADVIAHDDQDIRFARSACHDAAKAAQDSQNDVFGSHLFTGPAKQPIPRFEFDVLEYRLANNGDVDARRCTELAPVPFAFS
jgi:hypothetical protein